MLETHMICFLHHSQFTEMPGVLSVRPDMDHKLEMDNDGLSLSAANLVSISDGASKSSSGRNEFNKGTNGGPLYPNPYESIGEVCSLISNLATTLLESVCHACDIKLLLSFQKKIQRTGCPS
jgi:hypothetical protein